MSIGLGAGLHGAMRGIERRRAIDIEDENRAIAKADRDRKIRIEDEDRAISKPLAESNAKTQIATNDANMKVLPSKTENALKQEQVTSGDLDHKIETQPKRNAIDVERLDIESQKVGAEKELLPTTIETAKATADSQLTEAEFKRDNIGKQLLRADDIQRMQHANTQMEHEVNTILQGARTQEAEMKLGQLTHQIYGNIYQIAKSDPRTAAQMFNDVKSNGITTAHDVLFEDGKMRFVDEQGNVLKDDNYGLAEFDIEKMEQAFGAQAEKGTFKVSNGVMYDTRNGDFQVIRDENGQPIKDGDTAKLERYVQNDIWKRAGDTFGAKLGDNFQFSGEGAQYATEAQTRAFQYYKQAGDGDLTVAWQRAYEEVQAMKNRDDYGNRLTGARGAISDADHTQIASNLESLFVPSDRNPVEINQFMAGHGVKDLDDRLKVLTKMGVEVGFYDGKNVVEVDGNLFEIE